MHELSMLHAFNCQEISNGIEDILEVGHLCLDVKGRGHSELAVAQLIEFFEDFDHLGVEGAISEKILIRAKISIHLGSQLRMGFQFQSAVLGKDRQNLRKLLPL